MDKTSFKGNFNNNVVLDNPVVAQTLGICSTLAVTNLLINTLVMTIAVVFVTAFSSFTVSLIKDLIPKKVRMIVQVIIISFYVILVDIILKAYVPEISNQLGAYVGLIITNCIIMGRAEAFAGSNRPLISFWDGITSGFGYMLVLILIAIIRELLGFGTLLGISILPSVNSGGWFTPWSIMVSSPSAFFILALIVWWFNTYVRKTQV